MYKGRDLKLQGREWWQRHSIPYTITILLNMFIKTKSLILYACFIVKTKISIL